MKLGDNYFLWSILSLTLFIFLFFDCEAQRVCS